jgi:hypothetical protein
MRWRSGLTRVSAMVGSCLEVRNGKWYLGASPSKKSVQRLKTSVGNLLVPGNNDPWSEVRDTLNRALLLGRLPPSTRRHHRRGRHPRTLNNIGP